MFRIQEFLDKHPPHRTDFTTIAIDGRGASGKSQLATYLRNILPGYVFVSGDDYFEPVQGRTEWGDFNNERFESDVIGPLRSGTTFMYRPYDWHANAPISEQSITVTEGFCLERCFSFALALEWDLRIWVETPRDVCLSRGVARETFPPDRSLATWRDIWQPREDLYITQTRPRETADIVVEGTRPFSDQITF
jgi:uridine kinase